MGHLKTFTTSTSPGTKTGTRQELRQAPRPTGTRAQTGTRSTGTTQELRQAQHRQVQDLRHGHKTNRHKTDRHKTDRHHTRAQTGTTQDSDTGRDTADTSCISMRWRPRKSGSTPLIYDTRNNNSNDTATRTMNAVEASAKRVGQPAERCEVVGEGQAELEQLWPPEPAGSAEILILRLRPSPSEGEGKEHAALRSALTSASSAIAVSLERKPFVTLRTVVQWVHSKHR